MSKADEINRQIKGFIVPEFSQHLPNGQRLNLVSRKELSMIQQGYACGECLAIFRHYTVTCPACGFTRDVAADIQYAPQHWVDHLEERAREDAPATQIPTIDDALAHVMDNADVTEIGKPRRRGK